MKVHDDNGNELDATFSVEDAGEHLSVVFESKGGTRGSPDARNIDYNQGLELLLARLASLEGVLVDTVIETRDTSNLPAEQRRVVVDGTAFPISLADVYDIAGFRKSMSSAQSKLGRAPGSRGGGNPTKRIRLTVGVPGLNDERLASLLVGDVSTGEREAVELQISPKRRGRAGQGRGLPAPARLAVERLAMDAARAYYEQTWPVVEDVSANRSFDLLCSDGDGQLHVEVKGTTGDGSSVLLTPNEVLHARSKFPNVALFVLWGVMCDQSDPDAPVASAGTAVVFEPWNIDEHELVPVGFECRLSVD